MIEFLDVGKAFDGKQVLRGLGFTVGKGALFGLLGPNGSGKSTAINILCNLLDPDRGEVRIAGQKASLRTRRLLGVAPQEIALYRDLHCDENLRFFARLYGLPSSEAERRVNELLDLFQLSRHPRITVSRLSGGWQRRLNIAVALVNRPEILVLDEPTAAVDVEARHELWRLIETLKDSGITILLTTHHLEEAERLCTRIGIMNDGRLVADGTVEDLVRRVPAAQIALVEAGDEARIIECATSLGWAHRRYAGRLGLLLPERHSIRETVEKLDCPGISSLSLHGVSLEHAYLEVISKQQ